MSKSLPSKIVTFSLYAIMGAITIYALSMHVKYLMGHEYLINDTVIYIPPFFSYLENTADANYSDKYILNAIIPIGYKAAMSVLIQFFDHISMTKLINFATLTATILLIGLAVKQISGRLVGLAAMMVTICISASFIYWGGTAGGTPRSFGFPLVVLAAYGLITCRPYLLGGIAIFSTLVYPQAGVLTGLAMAIMLILPKEFREKTADWSFKRRIAYIFSIMFVSAILLLPQFFNSLEYGPLVNVNTVEQFPEAGKKGSYLPGDTIPHDYGEIAWAVTYFQKTLDTNGVPFIDLSESSFYNKMLVLLWLIVFFVISIGMNQIVRKENAPTVRFFLLLAASLLLFLLAVLLQPYLYMPRRYLLYTIPVLIMVLLPISLVRLLNQNEAIKKREGLSQTITAVALTILVLLYGGNGYYEPKKFTDGQKQFMSKIDSLDNKSIIAAWPNDVFAGQLRIQSKAKSFLTLWDYQTLHEKHILFMRERMDALIDAYFATDIAAIKKLKDKYQVSHIIIKKDHYGEKSPFYTAPFTQEIEEIHAANKDSAILNNHDHLRDAVISQTDDYILYDIDTVIEKGAFEIPSPVGLPIYLPNTIAITG